MGDKEERSGRWSRRVKGSLTRAMVFALSEVNFVWYVRANKFVAILQRQARQMAGAKP